LYVVYPGGQMPDGVAFMFIT